MRETKLKETASTSVGLFLFSSFQLISNTPYICVAFCFSWSLKTFQSDSVIENAFAGIFFLLVAVYGFNSARCLDAVTSSGVNAVLS